MLAWGIIVKPTDDEAKLLEKSLASFNGVVDKFFITEAGDKPNPKIKKLAEKYDAHLSFFSWVDDFAAARNFNFSQIPDEYDWVGWSDADDTIKNPETIKGVLENVPKEAMAVWVNYVYDRDKYGNTVIEHWRERIIRHSAGYKWVGVVHETLIDHSYPKVVKTTDFEIIHEHPDNNDKISVRNLGILEKEIRRQKDSGDEVDPRLIYYLASTFKTMGDYQSAIVLFKQFVAMSGWDEQRYDAYLQMSDASIEMQEWKLAADFALMAINERPEFPDGYYQMGKVYFNQEKWEKTIEWVEMGLAKKPASTDWAIVARKPQALLYYATALTSVGKFKESNTQYEELLKLWPKEESIKEQIEMNTELQTQKDVTNAFFKIYKFNHTHDKALNKFLLQAVPDELKDNPAILQMKWKINKKKWSDKSIVIYCGESWEQWSPAITDRGIGGSEEATIELSKQLVGLGWEVTVFNSCGDESGVYDGVEYRNFWEFNPEDEYNILIGWRTPEFFNREYTANKKYLWMHDVFPKEVWSQKILNNIDKVMVLSKYHRELWPNIPEEKIFYFQNGLVPEHFKHNVKRIPHKVLYSSCPSRGLENLLRIWPEVRKAVPDAELHFFYGWTNFIKGNSNYASRMEWMREMQELAKQEGIVDRGRIGHKELAKEMLSSDIWAYPCTFPEISCITAMKAQASGAYPVVVPYAALEETVQYGDKVSLDDYKDALIKRLKAPQDDLRKEMSDWSLNKFSWLKTAEILSEELS
jgi:glycosyltransferase involved in cell wall biosynthesis